MDVLDLDVIDVADLDTVNAVTDNTILNGGVLDIDNMLNNVDVIDNDGSILSGNEYDVVTDLIDGGVVNTGDITVIGGDVVDGGILTGPILTDVIDGGVVTDVVDGGVLTDVVDGGVLNDLDVLNGDILNNVLTNVTVIDNGSSCGCEGSEGSDAPLTVIENLVGGDVINLSNLVNIFNTTVNNNGGTGTGTQVVNNTTNTTTNNTTTNNVTNNTTTNNVTVITKRVNNVHVTRNYVKVYRYVRVARYAAQTHHVVRHVTSSNNSMVTSLPVAGAGMSDARVQPEFFVFGSLALALAGAGLRTAPVRRRLI